MDERQELSVKEIQNSLENLLNAKTVLKNKKPTKEDQEFEVFERIINGLEGLNARSNILENDLELNISSYEKEFHYIIGDLLELHYGEDAFKLIHFYIYERVEGINGNIVKQLLDSQNRPIPLNNVSDLWELIKIIRKKTKKPRNI